MNPAIIERSVPAASRFLRRFVLSLRASCALMSVFVLLAFAGQVQAQIHWVERTGTVQDGKVFPYAVGETIQARFELPNPSNHSALQTFLVNGCSFDDDEDIDVRGFSQVGTACNYDTNTFAPFGATFGITGLKFHEHFNTTNANLETGSNTVGAAWASDLKAIEFKFSASHSGTVLTRNFTFSFFTLPTLPAQSNIVLPSGVISYELTPATNGYRGVDGTDALAYSIALSASGTALPGIGIDVKQDGTPVLTATRTTATYAATGYTLTVEDSDGNTATTDFTIAVEAVPLAFNPSSQTAFYIVNSSDYQIGSTQYTDNLTLPAASGGDGSAHVYADLTTFAVPGLTGAAQTNGEYIISGAPTMTGEFAYLRTVANTGGMPDATFSLTLHVVDKLEFAGGGQDDFLFTPGQTGIAATPLAAASGGFGTLAYSISPATFATDVVYDDSVSPPTISGAPSVATDETVRYTLTVTDDNGAQASTRFSIRIAGALSVAVEQDLVFTVGETLSLSAMVDGGAEPYTNELIDESTNTVNTGTFDAATNTFDNGLVFDPATSTIAGQLNVTSAAQLTYGGLTYKVTDANGATANDEFSFTVQPITFIQSRRELLVNRGRANTYPLFDPQNFRSAAGGTVDCSATLEGDRTYPGLDFNTTTCELFTTTEFDENILPSEKITYIIAATFQYGGAPAVQTVVITASNAEELLPINEVVLSEVASASVAGTLGAITDRLAEANILAPYFSIGGQSPLMALATNAKAWADGELDEKEVLNNSQLILPLGVGGGQTIWSQIALWASAHYRNMHGDNDAIDWKGSVSGGHIGFDVAASENMLFGLAFSRTKADMEYRILENDVEGGHIMTLRSVYPYLNWRIGESNLWASVGDGEGEITISQDGEEFESDVGLIAVGLGVSNDVSPQVQLRLEMRGGELDIEGNEARTVLAQDISTNTARAMIKWHDSALRSDMRSAFVEIGVRNDGGDGDTGASMETAMGYKQHSHLATTIEFVIHGLVGREDYNEWGAFGQFRMAAGFDGQGLALRMRPSYGESQGEFGRVWDDELVDKLTGDDDADAYQWRNESRLSYGIQSARGLIAPFGEIISAGDDIYRLGVDWSPRNLWTRHIDLNLTGEHHRNQAGANERRVLLQGEVKF